MLLLIATSYQQPLAINTTVINETEPHAHHYFSSGLFTYPGTKDSSTTVTVDSGTTDTYLPRSVAKGVCKAKEAITGSVKYYNSVLSCEYCLCRHIGVVCVFRQELSMEVG